MRFAGLVVFVLVQILSLVLLSCATPKPVLYNDGKPLTITDYEKLAQAEYDEDRYENAIEVYRSIIENYPDNQKALAWAYYEIGFCYFVLKDYDNAMVNFRKVLNEFQEPAAKKLAGQIIAEIEQEKEEK
ncbi:MAG: tetratricopeptide repeat protein [Spirochaetota bacterium]|nr:MAG: tetratricopeptide repeat protein [Spirochaetota bacterium]